MSDAIQQMIAKWPGNGEFSGEQNGRPKMVILKNFKVMRELLAADNGSETKTCHDCGLEQSSGSVSDGHHRRHLHLVNGQVGRNWPGQTLVFVPELFLEHLVLVGTDSFESSHG